MKKTKTNYFIQDKVLIDSDYDFFRHKDLAKTIANLINNDNYSTPYNIALIGKWGVGKSSLLKFIEPQIKEKCVPITINGWKYEKESLKRVYLKAIYEEMHNYGRKSKKRILTTDRVLEFIRKLQLEKKEDKNNSKTKFKSFKFLINNMKEHWKFIFFIVIISILFAMITKTVSFVSSKGDFSIVFGNDFLFYIAKFFDYYFDNFTSNFFLPLFVALVIKYMDEIKTKIKTPVNIEYPIETADDYEVFLKIEIDELLKRTKKEKIVVVIDDLDRLSTSKIVEALDTLKILMEINKCIFIVPFDDTLIKNALEKKVVSQVDSEHQTIKSELILDKLFQFKFYLPPLIPSDKKDYTLDIIKKEAPDFVNLFEIEGNNYFEEIIKKTIIYDGLETPRQIKKIINVFASNRLIIKERCEFKKTESGLISKDGLFLLGKLSVLQADFNDFYDSLFVENSNIDKLLNIHESPVKFEEIPYELRFLFEKSKINRGISKIKKENEGLINYLYQTRSIGHKNISAYLYLNQDKFSVKYGSEFNQRITSAIKNTNITTAIELIKESKNDLSELIYEILEDTSNEDLSNALISVYGIVQIVESNNQSKLSNLISDRTNEAYPMFKGFSDYSAFSIDNLLYVNSSVDQNNKKGIVNFLVDFIDKTFTSDKVDLDTLINIINNLIEKENQLDNKVKEQLKKSINYSFFDTNLMDINFFVEKVNLFTSNQFLYYLGMPFYKLLCSTMEELQDVDERYIKWLNLSVDSLIKSDFSKDETLEPLSNLYNKESNLKFLNDLVFKNWSDINE
ncbi:MAG: P-loop NTPase fold protein [Bacilli bacterium]|nr:P-loop NTPase fold protein [Bacilli bacterium]MDD4407363.1 P-loop NTPase fold protein [Bacilli bacterium]